MRRPFWRKQSKTWVVKLPGGKIKTLGKDEHGDTRKHPPKEIAEAWHAIDWQGRPQDMLFADVAEKYLDYLTNPQTKQSAEEHLDRFMAFTGKMIKVSDLRVHHVTEFLKTRSWSDSMKATAINFITSALNYAKAEGLIEEHKVVFAKGRKPRYARRETILTPKQQKQLEDGSPAALRMVLVGLRESGCRPGELCGVTIDKVDFTNRLMLVPNKTKKQTGIKERTVYLSPAMSKVMVEAIGERTQGPVFLNGYGRRWTPSAISHGVRKLRIKLGLPEGTVPYIIRHGFISNAINDSDANAALIAKLVGHADLTMLMRVYFKENPAAMRRAIDQIARNKKGRATALPPRPSRTRGTSSGRLPSR